MKYVVRYCTCVLEMLLLLILRGRMQQITENGNSYQNRGWRKRGQVPNEPIRNVGSSKDMGRESGGDYKD
jgi:hypothetical protein